MNKQTIYFVDTQVFNCLIIRLTVVVSITKVTIYDLINNIVISPY